MKNTKIQQTKPSNTQSYSSLISSAKEGRESFFSAPHEATAPFFGPYPIQAKLTVGQPNDKYEQEADRMAEQVTHKLENPVPTPAIQRKCDGCEEEVQRKEEESGEMTVMRKPLMASSGDTDLPSSSVEEQLKAAKGKGSALSEGVKSGMESAFGADFGSVRIHTDSTSVQMNKELGARAFTHGQDVFFNRQEYSPETSGGKKLLAHELTHVQQQKGSGTAKRQLKDKEASTDVKANDISRIDSGAIQRKMGLEFQTSEEIVKHNRSRRLTRRGSKTKPIQPKNPSIKTDLRMEVDTDSVIEFVTGAHDKWQPLSDEIKEAEAIFDFIKTLPVKRNRRLKKDVYSGFKTKNYGKLDVEKSSMDFIGRPQSTEGLLLRDFPSYLQENDGGKTGKDSVEGAERIVTNRLDSDLRGFITLIIYYIKRLKVTFSKSALQKEVNLPKRWILLMTRMNFVDLLQMLNDHDQRKFREMVKKEGQNEIEKEAGVNPSDALLPNGYWIKNRFRNGYRSLFSHFLIVPLGKQRSEVRAVWLKQKRDYYDNKDGFRECKNLKRRHKKYCVRMRSKVRRYPIVSVRNWQLSMYNKAYKKRFKKKFARKRKYNVDLLAPLPGWGLSEKGGYSMGTWAKTPGGLAAFEMRGYPTIGYKNWHRFAKDKYASAAAKRKRLGKP